MKLKLYSIRTSWYERILIYTSIPWLLGDAAQSAGGYIISRFIIKCHWEQWGWHTSIERNLHWSHFILMNTGMCFKVAVGSRVNFLNLSCNAGFKWPSCFWHQILIFPFSIRLMWYLFTKNSQHAQLELINWRRMPITSYRHFCCLGLSVSHYLCISTSHLTAEKPSK